jgi:hypothetical protein
MRFTIERRTLRQKTMSMEVDQSIVKLRKLNILQNCWQMLINFYIKLLFSYFVRIYLFKAFMIIEAKPKKQKPHVRVLFFPIKTHER